MVMSEKLLMNASIDSSGDIFPDDDIELLAAKLVAYLRQQRRGAIDGE